MPEETWETVLQDALHSTRSLLCTSTNSTPHERFFRFQRRSMLGKSLPNWLLNPGPVFLRNHVRNKGDPLCEEVELIESNFSFAHVRFPDGRETTVSTKDLAPNPSNDFQSSNVDQESSLLPDTVTDAAKISSEMPPDPSTHSHDITPTTSQQHQNIHKLNHTPSTPLQKPQEEPRRSTRIRKPPVRYGDPVYH